MNPAAHYWDRGIDNVPRMTGAETLLDGSDIAALGGELGIPLPVASLLDIGCGTGRAARFCSGPYHGVDIAESAVRYCLRAGLSATRIEGPADLKLTEYDWVFCLSVFTHIRRQERQADLEKFKTRARVGVLVDIIPGDGTGTIVEWSARPDEFYRDVRAAGFDVAMSTARVSPTGIPHAYFRLAHEKVRA